MPVHIEAERSILGSILIDPALVEHLIAANLRPCDFSLDANRRIFQRILDLVRTSRPVNEISVADELKSHQELELIGGCAYLSDLINLVVPERTHVLDLSGIVIRHAKLRGLQVLGERVQAAAGSPGADPMQLGQEWINEIMIILAGGTA